MCGGNRQQGHSPDSSCFRSAPEVRPLPSTDVTRLLRYYEPVRHPTRPGLSLAGVRLGDTPPTAGVSRVAWTFLVQTCRRQYPGGNAGGDEVVPPVILASAAFPIPLLGRLPHHAFRGLHSVHIRYGLSARGVAIRPFPSKASTVLLPPLPLRSLPAGMTSCRVGIAPTERSRLGTAHKGDASNYP